MSFQPSLCLLSRRPVAGSHSRQLLQVSSVQELVKAVTWDWRRTPLKSFLMQVLKWTKDLSMKRTFLEYVSRLCSANNFPRSCQWNSSEQLPVTCLTLSFGSLHLSSLLRSGLLILNIWDGKLLKRRLLIASCFAQFSVILHLQKIFWTLTNSVELDIRVIPTKEWAICLLSM